MRSQKACWLADLHGFNTDRLARSSILENRHHPNTLNGRNGESELQYLVKHFVKWSSPFCLPIHWEKDILVPSVKHWDESYSRNLIHLFLCNLGKHEDKKLRTAGLLPFVWIDSIPFPSLTTTLPYTHRIMGGGRRCLLYCFISKLPTYVYWYQTPFQQL